MQTSESFLLTFEMQYFVTLMKFLYGFLLYFCSDKRNKREEDKNEEDKKKI